jgi:phosphomethylpyrimidine synthase
MTQLESAKKKKITPAMRLIAPREKIPVGKLLRLVASGRAVIPLNATRQLEKPCAVGSGLLTKVNVNIGTSPDISDPAEELKKLKAAVEYGTDTVMDLSIGGDIPAIRKIIIAHSPVPVGTVPVYEIAVRAAHDKGHFLSFTQEDMLDVLEQQARDGVDFFTIHAGVTRAGMALLAKRRRVMDIVSRGGAMLAGWMARTGKENPFYTAFDKILDIAYRYDVTLSLGDGMRPGSIFDASDAVQFQELKILGRLARECRRRNVQVMIEGPGHVPLDQVAMNIRKQKEICDGAPFYVLGPLVTDVGAGYDHITAAIGGALAGASGADFLCYVTPAEHLRLPTLQDVREGVIASRIAGHAADIVKKNPLAFDWDRKMSRARKRRDWQAQIDLSIDPEKAREYRASAMPRRADVCTMCGEYCSIKVMGECFSSKK